MRPNLPLPYPSPFPSPIQILTCSHLLQGESPRCPLSPQGGKPTEPSPNPIKAAVLGGRLVWASCRDTYPVSWTIPSRMPWLSCLYWPQGLSQSGFSLGSSKLALLQLPDTESTSSSEDHRRRGPKPWDLSPDSSFPALFLKPSLHQQNTLGWQTSPMALLTCDT